jgi:hypothetical protein
MNQLVIIGRAWPILRAQVECAGSTVQGGIRRRLVNRCYRDDPKEAVHDLPVVRRDQLLAVKDLLQRWRRPRTV